MKIFSVIFSISRISILQNLECFGNQKDFLQSMMEECRTAKGVIYEVLNIPGVALFFPYDKLMLGSSLTQIIVNCFLSPDSSLLLFAKRH